MGEILWSRMATKGEFLLFEGLNNVVLGGEFERYFGAEWRQMMKYLVKGVNV